MNKLTIADTVTFFTFMALTCNVTYFIYKSSNMTRKRKDPVLDEDVDLITFFQGAKLRDILIDEIEEMDFSKNGITSTESYSSLNPPSSEEFGQATKGKRGGKGGKAVTQSDRVNFIDDSLRFDQYGNQISPQNDLNSQQYRPGKILREAYRKASKKNQAAKEKTIQVWGQSEIILREGMLQVFLRDDNKASIIKFNSYIKSKDRRDTKRKHSAVGSESCQSRYIDEFLDMGSIRETVFIGEDSVDYKAKLPEPSIMTYGRVRVPRRDF